MVELLIEDIPFGFLESGEDSPESSFGSGEDHFDDEDQPAFDLQESKAFWDQQLQVLQATLYRSNSVESKIREATRSIVRETKHLQCSCRNRGLNDDTTGSECCRDCLRREVCDRLLNLGFDCAVCNSKWKSTPSIPSGEHSYLEVLEKTRSGETMRVIIELNFRAEFEIARAGEDYGRLVGKLPEIFVGKSERLRDLIKILCGAAKQCMKERNMHLGPWRKHKYVQAKWLGGGGGSRRSPLPLPAGVGIPGGVAVAAKSKASLLTFDLSEAVAPLGGLRRATLVL